MLLDHVPATLLTMREVEGVAFLGDQRLDAKIEQALTQAERWEKRRRRLGAKLMVYLVLAMSLYRTLSIPEVFKELFNTFRNLPLWKFPPASSALAEARYRLGYEPLKELFESTAASVYPPPTFWEYRVSIMDGVRMAIADTPENEQEFGRPGVGRGRAAHPVARLVARASAYSHRVEAIDIGRCDAPEQQAVESLLSDLNDKDLVLLDRLYPSGDLFWLFKVRNVKVVARINSNWKPRIIKPLGVGDYIVEVAARRPSVQTDPERRSGARKPVVVMLRLRMLVYSCGKELIRLLTTLPETIPALDIAKLYSERWEIELTNDEFKNHFAAALHGHEKLCVRSKLPAGVRQEIYGMFAAFNFVRDVMWTAAERHGLKPLQLSFTGTLNAIRRIMPSLRLANAKERRRIFKELYKEIATHCRLRPRRNRQYPRKVKVKMSKYQCKRPSDVQTTVDYHANMHMVNPASRLEKTA